MRHFWKMAVLSVFMLLAGGFLTTHLQAQERYLEDNFDYTLGDLAGQGGWFVNRSATNAVMVEETAMNWPDYATTAKAVRLPASSAAKLSRQFSMDELVSGSVYYSFLLRVHDIAGANYFIGLGTAAESNSQVFGCVAVKKNTDDPAKYHIGVGRKGTPAASAWSAEAYDMTEPLLVVVRYTMVEGEKNDEVVLYAAPASLAAEPETPTSANATAGNPDCGGLNAVMLYPAGTSYTKNADVSISALRVAPTWEGLFAETPDAPKPVFSVQYQDQGGMFPIYVLQYANNVAHFTVRAENLTGDVTVVPPVKAGIAFDKTTLKKADLESSAGATLTVTFDADLVNVNDQSALIGFQTEGLDQPYQYKLEWLVQTVDKAASVAALKEKRISEDAYYALENLVVTHVDETAYETEGLNKYYAQDATGGILISDAGFKAYLGRAYEVGDRLPVVVGTVEKAGMMSVMTMSLAGDPGTAVAKGVAVEPETLTLSGLQAEKERYACVLVKIENVAFYNRSAEMTAGGMFAASPKSYSIRQSEEQTVFKARTLNGGFAQVQVPENAHLTGISTSVAGTVIGLRTPADIVALNTGGPVDPDPGTDPDPDESDDKVVAGENLFANAGFEAWDKADDFYADGKPTGWEINMGTPAPNTLDIYKIEGAKSLKVVSSGPLTNTLRQEVLTQYMPGKTYRIRLPYYIETGAADGKNLQLISYWQGPASVGEMDHDASVLNSGQYLETTTGRWDTLEFVTTAPEQATAFYFALRIAKKTTVYFDNFSFYRIENAADIKPRIFADTKFLGTIKAFVGQTDSTQYVNVNGELLTGPVRVEIAGEDAACFAAGTQEIALADMPQSVKIHYTPKAAGFHNAELLLSSPGAETVRVPLSAVGRDENAKPQLQILPETVETFMASKPGETQTKRLMISAMNMKDYVKAKVEGMDTGSFRLSNTMFLQDFENMPLDVTYMPRRAGEHNMTLVIYSTGDRVERRIPLKGICSENVETDWIETFERIPADLTYGDQYVTGEKGNWHLVDAVGGNDENRDVFNGARSIRLGGVGAELAMDFDLMTGIDAVTMVVAACKDAQETAKWRLETSSDFGLTWTAAGAEQSVGAAGVAQTVTVEVKRAGVQRLRIVKTGGAEATAAMNVDDILITPMERVTLGWEALARLDESNPLDRLNEKFDGTRHNRPLVREGWRNFIVKGDRPWWTYQAKDAETGEVTEYMAKATAYNSLVDEANPYEMWLVTPALSGKANGSKLFTFRVMGDLMVANQAGGVECYFIERFADTMARSRIDLAMPSIPDENGEWFEYHLDMALVEDLPDVFFIGFRFEGPGGRSNSATYYIDDVSYGRTDVARITSSVSSLQFEAMADKIAESDAFEIKGLNLTEDIHVTVGGDHPSSFTPSFDVLPSSGGTLRVGFIGSQAGIYSAWLRLSSKGAADVFIPMEVRVSAAVPTIVVAEKDLTLNLKVKSPAVSATSEPIVANPFYLTAAIDIAVEGDDAALFKVSRSSIPVDGVNESFTVTFTPAGAKASGVCVVRLSSAGASDVYIKVTGTSDLANEVVVPVNASVWRVNGGEFHVRASGMRELHVYALSGHKVYADPGTGDYKTFNLSALPSGVYVLEVRTATAVQRIRIVR